MRNRLVCKYVVPKLATGALPVSLPAPPPPLPPPAAETAHWAAASLRYQIPSLDVSDAIWVKQQPTSGSRFLRYMSLVHIGKH